MITLKSIKSAYNGFFKIKLINFEQQRFDGTTMEDVHREVFERKPVVFLSLYDPKAEKFLFVEQHRAGAIVHDINKTLVLEPIAGIIDDGETPLEAAVREAKEETNCDVDINSIKVIQEGYTSPGGSSEYAYYATGLFDSKNYTPQLGGEENEQEDIRTHLICMSKALEMVKDGRLNSLSGAFGVYWHKVNSKK